MMKKKILYKLAILLFVIVAMPLKSCERNTRYCVTCDCTTLERCFNSRDRAESYEETMEIGGYCDCTISKE